MQHHIDDHLVYARAIVRTAIETLGQDDDNSGDRLQSLLMALSHHVNEVVEQSNGAVGTSCSMN